MDKHVEYQKNNTILDKGKNLTTEADKVSKLLSSGEKLSAADEELLLDELKEYTPKSSQSLPTASSMKPVVLAIKPKSVPASHVTEPSIIMPPHKMEKLGMTVQQSKKAVFEKSDYPCYPLKVTEIVPGSLSEELGLKVNDRIYVTSIFNDKINHYTGVKQLGTIEALLENGTSHNVNLLVQRQGPADSGSRYFKAQLEIANGRVEKHTLARKDPTSFTSELRIAVNRADLLEKSSARGFSR